MTKTALILEGGGMRGMYTCGVLDCFLDHNIEFDAVFAVSAGALHATSYISKQRGRSFKISTDYINDPRYCSMQSFFKTGNFLGYDFAFNQIPRKLNRFDHQTFEKSKTKLYAVATNIETGKPEYLKINKFYKDIKALQASASLPLISKNIKVKDKYYLDGGISDSIPLKKAIEMGYDKCIVICTQPSSYKKGPNKLMPLLNIRYFKYKELRKSLKNRHEKYNSITKELIDNNNILVIQPTESLGIGRTEKNLDKIKVIYDLGYADTNKLANDIDKFLKTSI